MSHCGSPIHTIIDKSTPSAPSTNPYPPPSYPSCHIPVVYPPIREPVYDPLPPSFFYNTSNKYLIILFVIFMVVVSILGLIMYTRLVPQSFVNNINNDSVSVYIGIVSIYIGVSLAFIIADEWQRFRESSNAMSVEASSLGLLYDTLDSMPNTTEQRFLLRQYINYIIYIEFPSLENGIIPEEAPCVIDRLSRSIYNYIPPDTRSYALFTQAISLLSQSLELRTDRLRSSLTGIQQELWWVLVPGIFIVIIMSWFIKGTFMYKIIMTTFIAIASALLLFLAVALNYQFRGDFGLAPDAFKLVLSELPPPDEEPKAKRERERKERSVTEHELETKGRERWSEMWIHPPVVRRKDLLRKITRRKVVIRRKKL